MNVSARRLAVLLIKFLLPAGIIAVLLARLDPQQWQVLGDQSIRWPMLGAAFCVAFLAIALSFVRWWVLVRCQDISLSLREAFRLSSICFLLSFVSAGSVGGDLFKAVFLARRSPGRRIGAVASVVVDRGAGLFGLLLLVSVGLWLRPAADPFEFNGIGIRQFRAVVAFLMISGCGLLAVLVLGGRFVDRVIIRGSRLRFVGSLIGAVGPPLRTFHSHPWALAMSLLMSVGVQGMLVVSIYLIAISMYPSPPTFAEHFVIVPVGMLASALPLTPAGVGVLEATIETLYHLVPARATEASGTLVALMFELVKVVLAVVGTIFYWTASREEQESLAYAEEHGEHAMEDLDDSSTSDSLKTDSPNADSSSPDSPKPDDPRTIPSAALQE